MPTKAATIKVADLAKAVEKAIAVSPGKRFPGPIIMGIIVRPDANFNAAASARSITREVGKLVPNVKLTSKVITDGGFTTMGFIFRPEEFVQ